MKIQIDEPNKETTVFEKGYTYISYHLFQSTIPKAPENVRLSDVKDFIQEENIYFQCHKFEYYFMTRDKDGNVIDIEITNDDQPIPLLEGVIKVKTIQKKTEVQFRIIDKTKRWVAQYLDFIETIPISLKKPKTLETVKRAIPDYVQKFLKNGKSVKYFFEYGYVRKELSLDSAEVPVVELPDGKKAILCWIMISPDLCQKFHYRQNCFWYLVTCLGFLLCIIMIVIMGIDIPNDIIVKKGGYMMAYLDFVAMCLLIMPLAALLWWAFFVFIEENFLKKLFLK